MINVDWRSAFTLVLELTVLAGAAFYAVFVLISYLSNGPQPYPEVSFRDPGKTAQRLTEWLGVELVALSVRVFTPVFAMLSEASAEVGDWFLNNLHHESR